MFERLDEPRHGPADCAPKGLDEIQRSEISKLFGKLVNIRLVISPLFTLVILWLAFHEQELWRRTILSCVVVAFVLFSFVELRRFRSAGMMPGALALNLGLAVGGVLIGSFATGGVESPVLPMVVVISLLNGLFVEPRLVQLLFASTQVAVIWTMAAAAVYEWVPGFNLSFFGGGRRSGHNDVHLWTSAFFATAAVLAAFGIGKKMRQVFNAMIARALEAREESLRAHSERAREMTALSGEIAHELKNPLASIKGLSALIAKDAPDGKIGERLSVLRREVDRMQGILEEFLNFSRPLVPLQLERADLSELCRQVAALHEGLARERGVALHVEGPPVLVRCDPRKVKQVLINLVQNALEATPSGGAVQVAVTPSQSGVRVEVVDQGMGIDPELGDRVFEPGVTTKARGSGLGLTIARSLARQHGGELKLGPAKVSGCVAELTLPTDPPAVVESAGANP